MNANIRISRLAAPALVILAAAACRDAGAEEPQAAEAVPVRLAPVAEEWVTRPVEGTGTLTARDEITLSFKIGGVVLGVPVAEGQQVRRGQVLATLDLREIDAQVGRARSALDKAERDLARARSLYADSVATLEQVQNAATGAEVARADVQAAAFNRRYATITAPAAGTILRRLAEGGELVSPGQPVLVLGSSERGAVLRVGVADRDAVRIKAGDAATVRFDAFPGEELRGSVVEVAAAANPATGTYEVEVSVDAGGRTLASGLVGRVEIRPAEGRRMQLVPIEAIVEGDGDRATVYMVDEPTKRARRVPVTVAFIQGARVAISGGLDGVGRVVTDGAAYLADGVEVQVAP